MKSTTTKKGQIVIPAKLRKKYGIKAGTDIHIKDEDGKIVLTPITPEYISSLRGITKGSGALKMLEEERRKDREREDEKYSI